MWNPEYNRMINAHYKVLLEQECLYYDRLPPDEKIYRYNRLTDEYTRLESLPKSQSNLLILLLSVAGAAFAITMML
jgi:hypothetical protein